jgi:hypothetical protein
MKPDPRGHPNVQSAMAYGHKRRLETINSTKSIAGACELLREGGAGQLQHQHTVPVVELRATTGDPTFGTEVLHVQVGAKRHGTEHKRVVQPLAAVDVEAVDAVEGLVPTKPGA